MAKGKKKEEVIIEEPQTTIESITNAPIPEDNTTNEELAEEITDTPTEPETTEETTEQGPNDISEDAQRLDNDSQLGQEIPDELRDKLGCDGEKTDSEALIEKAEETLKGEEQLEEALRNNDTDAAKEILEAELKKAEAVKNELKSDIEKKEEKIRKRKFRHNFAGFWNGVSSGWDY